MDLGWLYVNRVMTCRPLADISLRMRSYILFAAAAIFLGTSEDQVELTWTILAPGAAPTILFLADSKTAWALARTSANGVRHAQDRRQFTGVLLANALATHADQVALALASTSVAVASSAAAQKPGIAIATIGSAISNYTLPRVSRMGADQTMRALRKVEAYTPLIAVGGLLALVAGDWLLPVIYGTHLANPTVFALIVTAYLVGVLTPIYSNGLVANALTSHMVRIAATQAIVVAAFSICGARLGQLWLLGLGILIGRILATLDSRRVLTRDLRQREVPQPLVAGV